MLFIDPASISSGWALFKDATCIKSGTVRVDESFPVFERLSLLYDKYSNLNLDSKIDEAHIEQLVRNTHIYTHYSVGVIGTALKASGIEHVAADIPIKSWQHYVDWDKNKKRGLSHVKSEDELAAIYMGVYYVNNKI